MMIYRIRIDDRHTNDYFEFYFNAKPFKQQVFNAIEVEKEHLKDTKTEQFLFNWLDEVELNDFEKQMSRLGNNEIGWADNKIIYLRIKDIFVTELV